jgi:hypothetical protein
MSVNKAFEEISKNKINIEEIISFEQYLENTIKNPKLYFRNIFQIFNDMLKYNLGEGTNEFENDIEYTNFLKYDCKKLFIDDCEKPFFADRLFINKLVNIVKSFNCDNKQNKLYIFKGPPGSGKSTFINNILKKLEDYSKLDICNQYELLWELDLKTSKFNQEQIIDKDDFIQIKNNKIIINCPNHDHPILIIPKEQRKEFINNLITDENVKNDLFNNKEYEWLFKKDACKICSSLFNSLLEKNNEILNDKTQIYKKAFDTIFVKKFIFDRKCSNGISIFNPNDDLPKQTIFYNSTLQKITNTIFNNEKVKFIHSHYSKINNGVYSLMDIKSNNKERLLQLHNIISEGVNKTCDLEENLNMLLLAVMNPEDEKNINEINSFQDRIEYINIPFVTDINTEINIFEYYFDKEKIKTYLFPKIINNFARFIISTRLLSSNAIRKWLGYGKYRRFCDDSLFILQMELYSGKIPNWLSEADKQTLTSKIKLEIINESDIFGHFGISGRESIKLFNDFINKYKKDDGYININNLCNFFTQLCDKNYKMKLSQDFIDSIKKLYNYEILQEIKESLFSFNEQQINLDIKNYLFSINFNLNTKQICNYTNQELEITNEFLNSIEIRILGDEFSSKHQSFRKETQKEYATKTLTKEIMIEDKNIEQTELFKNLYNKYSHNIQQKALDPFIGNTNFRSAIKDYGNSKFNTYDNKIKNDVKYLINNLKNKFEYTEKSAKEICIYLIDNEIVEDFLTSE